MKPDEGVLLAPRTTLGVGGPARYFVEARDEAEVVAAWTWARERGVALRVLGGGSNLVIADGGVDALVVRVDVHGVTWRETADAAEATVAAGDVWDDFVALAVRRGWAGVECLSGIPGLAGATPIQNVGAYGQEVSDTITEVRALDRTTGGIETLAARECGFGYRDSRFKRGAPERWIVLAVTYRLRPDGAPTIRYADIEKDLAARGTARPTLGDVRASVLRVRRTKSMVLDPADENRRSCGSFFMNPVLPAPEAARVAQRAGDPAMPRWAQPDGAVKLSAAWLIERAGFTRGHREGPVGLSTKHTLAIVAHDGACAADVRAFAARLQAAVAEKSGVRLVPEPVFWDA